MKLTSALATGSLLLALAGPAAAQPAAQPTAPAPPAPLAAEAPTVAPQSQPLAPAGEPKSESVALGLSLGGTLVSWGLFVGGMVLTVELPADGSAPYVAMIGVGALGTLLAPSIGNGYAGSFFTRGLGLRVGSMIGTFALQAILLDRCGLLDECSGAMAVGLAGLAVYIAGTVDDIRAAPEQARKHNRDRGFTIVPRASSDGAGLALAGWF